MLTDHAAGWKPVRTKSEQNYPSEQDIYQAAVVARACGFSVFAIGSSKKPIGRWKQWQTRRPTDRDLAKMFVGNTRVGGLAVVLGAISGFRQAVLACRDFDDEDGYQQWAEHRSELAAKLPTVRTRRGHHVYCRLWGEERFVKLPDGDLRADGGHYTVMPPSRHPLGGHYRWVANEPIGFNGIPVLTLAEAGFLDGYAIRSRSTAVSPTQPIHSPAKSAVPGATRRSRIAPEEPTNGLCPIADMPIRFQGLDLPVREAVLRSLPSRAGERNERILRLARALKDISPGVRADYWTVAVREWHRLALPIITTQDYDETWRDFAHAWGRAEKPISASRPRAAFTAGVESAEGQSAPNRLLAGCRALAAEVGQPFALSVRTAATALDVSPDTAHRLLGRLVEGGALIVVKKGEPSVRVRIASCFRLGALPTETIISGSCVS